MSSKLLSYAHLMQMNDWSHISYHYIQYGGLLKWGYPQIIRSNMIFQQINHPFGVPPFMEPPISLLYVYLSISVYHLWSGLGHRATLAATTLSQLPKPLLQAHYAHCFPSYNHLYVQYYLIVVTC